MHRLDGSLGLKYPLSGIPEKETRLHGGSQEENIKIEQRYEKVAPRVEGHAAGQVPPMPQAEAPPQGL